MTGQPSPGYSPASTPSGNPGEIATALAQVGQAVNLLQAILPKLPIGSDPHKAVVDSITKLSKVVPSGDQQPGVEKNALQNLQRQQDQSGQMMNVIRAMGGQGGLGGMQAQGNA